MLIYLLFFIGCDLYGYRLAFFRCLESMLCEGHVLRDGDGEAVQPLFPPRDTSAWNALNGVASCV